MPKRILIVEDDPFLSKAYHTILGDEGFEIEMAQDNLEGLKKAQEREPDLILLDILTPELGGKEFLKIYDVKNQHPKVKVIVLSNVASPELADEVVALGASSCRLKSATSPKEMVALIKETLAAS